MAERTENRRTRYTKTVIADALLEIMKKKPINKITIKEICDLADVNRSTFYTHFRDQYELLEKIENNLFEEIAQALSEQDPSKAIGEIFVKINQNKRLCKILFSENGDHAFLQKIMFIAQNACVDEWAKACETDRKTLEYIYAFTATGSVGMIEKWVEEGMKEPPENIAAVVEKITYGGLKAFGI